MSTDETLRRHAAAAADAVSGALEAMLPGAVEVGTPEVVPAGTPPLGDATVPAVAATVSFTDGASGDNLFVASVAAARRLAAVVRGGEPVVGGHPLTADERVAFGEATTRITAAVAAAATAALGEEVETSAPSVTPVAGDEDARALGEGAPYSTRVPLTLGGEPCHFVQLLPKAVVLKMTRALDDLAATELGAAGGVGGVAADGGPDDILRAVRLRVCAEIGRATMPLAEAVAQPHGGLIELDSAADDPVDVFVNGRRLATGRLVLVDDEWAVRIEEILLDAADLPESASAVPVDRG